MYLNLLLDLLVKINVSYEAFYIFKKIYAGKIFQNALKNRKKSKGQSFLWAH